MEPKKEVDVRQDSTIKSIQLEQKKTVRIFIIFTPIIAAVIISISSIISAYISKNDVDNVREETQEIAENTRDFIRVTQGTLPITSINNNLKFWTPYSADSADGTRWKTATLKIEEQLIKIGGGWSRWKVYGNWVDDKGEEHPEHGYFYEINLPQDTSGLNMTIKVIEYYLTDEKWFNQKSIYMVGGDFLKNIDN